MKKPHPTIPGIVVHSTGQIETNSWRHGTSIHPGYENSNGYMRFRKTVDGKRKKFFVHRLVAETFIPNPDNKSFVNHIDGDPKNNNVDNLEWVTRGENAKHAIEFLGWKPETNFARENRCTTCDPSDTSGSHDIKNGFFHIGIVQG